MKVSLGVVLVVIIVVVAIISGVLALVPLLEASKSSSFDIASDFSETISDRITVRVESIFEDVQIGVDVMQRAINGTAVLAQDKHSIMSWMGTVLATSGNAQRSFFCLDGGSFVQMFLPDTFVYLADAATTAGGTSDDNDDSVAVTLGTIVYNATTDTTELGLYNISSELYSINETVAGLASAALECAQQPYYSMIRASRTWTPMFMSTAASTEWPHVIAGAPVLDPFNNHTSTGAFGFEFSAQRIEQYLHTLDIASSGVAALVDLDSGNVMALRLQSNIDVEGSMIDATTGVRRPWNPRDVPNDLIQRSFAAMGSAFKTCGIPCRRQQGDGYLSTLFVRVTEPYAAFNLSVRLILAIPSRDFLEGIQSSIVIGALSAAGGIVLLATLSAVLLFSCLKPLHHLEQRLYAIEVLREGDETSSAPSSFLREIYNIEVAYASMRSELIKMKSFLPQSVLRQLEEELVEEEEARAEGSRRFSSDSNDEDNQPGSPEKPIGFFDEPVLLDFHEDEDQKLSAFPLDMVGQSSSPKVQADAPSRVAANPLDVSSGRDERQSPVAAAASEKCEIAGEGSTEASAKTKAMTLPSSMMMGNPAAASIEGGLTAVNPLHVLNTRPDEAGGRQSPDVESLAPGMSMQTEFVALALSEKRKKRACRPTLQSLNDLCVLSAKRITVVMGNCIGFHQVLETQGPQGLGVFHATLVEIVLKEVNATGGVLDFIHGDRFLITYNASTTCIPHGICAAEMTLRVRAKLHACPELMSGFQGIRFGLSAGEALCGNFGNDVMKRFSAVGPVVHQAFTLMQQTKAEEGHCTALNLCCAAVYARIKNRAAAEHVNYVQLPGQTNAGLISTIRGLRRDIEPFDSLMSRTKIGFRKRAAAAAAAAAALQQKRLLQGTGDNLQPPGELAAVDEAEQDDDPTMAQDEIEMIDKINMAFETFANGDIDMAKQLSEELPPSRTQALKKAFQVCD